ncbi:unnamed protein product [Lactuca saligna]|uniref:Chlorophyllase n=1 Tax=Lactuca saligna TaxID=75948 RepID=A0AA35ZTS6_LACSI|nr:unnamed protein product [Lactuca saligna]
MAHSSFPVEINVFSCGKYHPKPIELNNEVTRKPLTIVTPLEEGEFPVLILLHGFLLDRDFYSQLSCHIASHGFIIVVPQLYEGLYIGFDADVDVESAAEITNWLPEGLQQVLPSQVKANLTKIGLAGHSRGGKAAFALVLNRLNTKLNLKFSALIGIDPVDGLDKWKQTQPKVLTYVPHSFDLEMPVMVIGSGLGEFPIIPIWPFRPCAPEGVNHKNFYNECRKPACYFVVKDYGHLDVLDTKTTGPTGVATYCMCKSGKTRNPMRIFVGGAVVTFLKASFDGDFSYLMAIKDDENSPVSLQTVDYML